MERNELGLDTAERAVAVVGLSAILPDAPDAPSFWTNVLAGRDSIREVPAERWDPRDYWSADPSAPDKTYCKIGAFVRGFQFDSVKFHIPPRIAAAMDVAQQWMLVCARAALLDAGHPDGTVDPQRVAVVFGNALGGELHELTTFRVLLPEVRNALERVPDFQALSPQVRQAIAAGMLAQVHQRLPTITEDSMPGELGNVIAGRVTNALNLGGMNFTVDAACASSLAAVQSACGLLLEGKADAVVTGGVDRTMGPSTFVKFSKIGALSPDGSRPFDAGANGFVMGEGCVALVLRRLADAERDGQRVYAVIRGIGGSSDGKGKGITAPNPRGQILAVRRAYEQAGFSPRGVGLIEAHGTSTKVGDAAEAESLAEVFKDVGLGARAVALGSVKSQIGHLKSAAGAAGMLKAIFALHHKVLPPTINVRAPNPAIPFERLPLYLNLEATPWERPSACPRRASVSAFGFGGTNFHVVLEEHVPELLTKGRAAPGGRESRPPEARSLPAGSASASPASGQAGARDATPPLPLVCLGASDRQALAGRVASLIGRLEGGETPRRERVNAADLAATERLVLCGSTREELLDRARKAAGALAADDARVWKALRNQGVFRGSGPAPKVAFLFPGQGSQYVGMLGKLRASDPQVRAVFDEADAVMAGRLPRALTRYVFAEPGPDADLALRDTSVCQPAVLAVDLSLLGLLARHGIRPDMVIGHSLGEYAALVAAGSLPFSDALQAVSARAREMASVSIADNGRMASVFAPEEKVREVLAQAGGYVVAANINARNQTVIGGATAAVEETVRRFEALGVKAVFLPVSHAFHTEIVAPASGPLRRVLEGLRLEAPKVTLVSNVTGEPYPTGPGAREAMLDLLARQIAAPVQFVRGLQTLHRLGARVFVEVGPKKILATFAEDVLGEDPSVVTLCTNHPKKGELESFTEALAALHAAGLGGASAPAVEELAMTTPRDLPLPLAASATTAPATDSAVQAAHLELGRMFAGFLESGLRTYQKHLGAAGSPDLPPRSDAPVASVAPAAGPARAGSVVISGASVGLPGLDREVFAEDNFEQILHGRSFIDAIPERHRRDMAAKGVVRLNKASDGSAHFETIEDVADVLKLAGQRGRFDLCEEFGLESERVEVFDITTRLAVAAGLLALRDAGIPLVRRYKTTSKGTRLPDRWALPASMADETGVIFASAWSGHDALLGEAHRYHQHALLAERLAELVSLRADAGLAAPELDRRIQVLEEELARKPFRFDRRFLFHVLTMGHSQLAELIGARGPNAHVNAACASGAQALGLATDWIRDGRCRRVLVVSGDDPTGENMMEFFGPGFLASGAATTEGVVANAAVPFDRRRRGLIMGMGAGGLVLEAEDAVRERGMRGIAEVLGVEFANSAFHGSRLDVEHIPEVMDRLVGRVERERGLRRDEIAPETVFVSHETYTPARGGSAAAEIHSLRRVFGDRASQVVIANTKGMTGHAMGAGVEESVTVKMLEHGIVPAVPNLKEPDPELGDLRLSQGGMHPVRFALRFAAGFGSQLAVSMFQKVKGPRVADSAGYQRWLAAHSGRPNAATLVEHKTLKVRDDGAPAQAPAKSTWVMGTGPTLRAEVEGPLDTRPSASPSMAAAVRAPVPSAAPSPAATLSPPGGAQVPSLGSLSSETIADTLLAVVSAKTGYPREMLALDLDLEADLGIDTVKQAEIFAETRQAFDLPRREDLRLRDYPTLGHLIKLVQELKGPAAPAARTELSAPLAVPATAAPAPGSASGPSAEAIADTLLGVVAAKTGYPREMLALDLDLEADLGIDTVKQAEIFAETRQAFDLPRREDLRLRDYPTLGHLIKLVQELKGGAASPPSPSAAAAASPAASSQVASVPAPASTGAAPSSEVIADTLLGVVAAKTGYPREMLALDLDLEADLGIDTVKQAEIFAETRQAFDLPRREDLKLRDYPTLGHLIKLVQELKSASAPLPIPGEPDLTPAAGSAPGAQGGARTGGALRRVPVPVIRPELDLCKQTGVTLQSGLRVALMPDAGGAAEALRAVLQERGVEVLWLGDGSVEDQAKAWLEAGPVAGLFDLAALDPEPELAETAPEAMAQALDLRIRRLCRLGRALFQALQQKGAFLVAATRMGGLHGYDGLGRAMPVAGATSGFIKALGRECPEALTKVVDFPVECDPTAIAHTLVAETLRDPAVMEVGYAHGARHGIGLVVREAPEGEGLQLGPDSVVLVTGAAGGITAAIARDLATASRGTFYLLDLAPLPDATNPDLARLDDRDGLRKELFERMKSGGGRVTPAMVEKALGALERDAAVLGVIRGIEETGARANYRTVDVRDPAAIARIVDEIREKHGRLDLLVHAAGLERSRWLGDKSQEEFDLVFDVKVLGLCNLLRAAREMPLGAVVSFCSIAGRFGNGGQTDYSAANDFLCKAMLAMPRWRPQTRALAVDWTAWGGMGMATRGSIPEMMRRAGIDMLDPADGVPFVRQQVLAGATGEVVLGKSLGVLVQPRDPDGGLDRAALAARIEGQRLPMVGNILRMDLYEGLVIETVLDPTAEPFLKDHQIDGVPVLPGVMGLEGFAEVARLVLPEYRVAGIEGIRFEKPMKYYRGKPRPGHFKAVLLREGEEIVARVSLLSERTLANGQKEEARHFTGTVRLTRKPTETRVDPELAAPAPNGHRAVPVEDIYRIYFHGPSYQVLDRVEATSDEVRSHLRSGLPPALQAGASTLLAPRLIELCLQTAGVWEIGKTGRLALPVAIDRLVAHAIPAETSDLRAEVRPRTEGGEVCFDARVCDDQGRVYFELTGYRTASLPSGVPEPLVESLRAAVGRATA